jgi:hypothetical protein
LEAAKKQAKERKQLEKDLQKELLDLEKQYNAAKIALLNDGGEAALAETRRQALAEVDQLVKDIEALNIKLGKPKALTGEQTAQVDTIKASIQKEYLDGIFDLQREHADRMFGLEVDSVSKELEAIQRKYAEMERLAKGNLMEIAAIRNARDRELDAAQLDQAKSGIAYKQELDITRVERAVKGPKEDQLSFEEAKEKKILEIRRKYAQEEYNLLKGRSDQESELRKAQLEGIIANIDSVQNDILKREKQFSLAKLFGMSEEDFGIVQDQVGAILSNISQITAAKVAAEEVIQAKTKEIDAAEEDLDREIQLNK